MDSEARIPQLCIRPAPREVTGPMVSRSCAFGPAVSQFGPMVSHSCAFQLNREPACQKDRAVSVGLFTIQITRISHAPTTRTLEASGKSESKTSRAAGTFVPVAALTIHSRSDGSMNLTGVSFSLSTTAPRMRPRRSGV